MKSSVVSTGMCPSQPPRTTRACSGHGFLSSLNAVSRRPSASVAVQALPVGGALLDRGQHALHVQAVGERRLGVAAGRDGVDEVADLVREGVLVAERVPGRPPVGHVRMLGLGHEDAREALLPRRRRRVVELQLVHRLEVEGDRAARAAELDAERVLAAGRVAGRLEGADRAVARPPASRAVNQAASSTVTWPRSLGRGAESPTRLAEQRALGDEGRAASR